ncbi:MAG TPA: hypothetical protein VHK28_04120, partial [Candidatus Limnocylindria bacterium]|nr:hypothetical protein [Candidatus Limnocylindria bacterium]
MSNRSRREAEARAEARRRARYQARGVPVEEPDEEASEADERRESRAPAAGGGFLTRLFPPAPPLPNRPDPLRNFSYSGPLRGVVAGLYLLMR